MRFRSVHESSDCRRSTCLVRHRRVVVAPPTAVAGPIRDKLRERAAQRQEAAQKKDDAAAVDEMEDSGGARTGTSLPPDMTAERDLAYGSDAQQRLDVYRQDTIPPASSSSWSTAAHGCAATRAWAAW